jgi:putative nucleotidyltransferase with HDIG domain
MNSATGLPAKIYLYSVPFLAVGLWGVLLVRLPLEHFGLSLIIQVLFFLALTIGAGLSPVRLPRGGLMTVAFAIDYAAILIFGPPIAAGIAAASAPFVLRHTPPFKVFWNSGQIAFSVLAAGYAYNWAGGEFLFRQSDFSATAVDFSQCLPALVLGGVVYVMVNTFAVAGAISASTGRSLMGTWMVSFRWMAGRFLAVAPFGVLMAIVFQIQPEALKIIALVLFFVPLLIARWAFKGSMEMLEVYNQTIHALSNALEAYDPYTRNHSERVTRVAELIARQMRLPETRIEALLAAARLHDMGKCRSDWEPIIRKPGRPTEEEWKVIRSHPADGAQIAGEIQVALLPSTAHIVRAHHERVDGKGYPDGLKGEEIDLAARILCVADSFEAITSRRSYQAKRPIEEGLSELRRSAGTQFDPRVVEALAEALAQNGNALEVEAALQAA